MRQKPEWSVILDVGDTYGHQDGTGFEPIEEIMFELH